MPEVQNSKSLSNMFSSTVINQEHQPIGTSLVGKEFSEESMRKVSWLSPRLCTTETLQKLVGQFLQKLTIRFSFLVIWSMGFILSSRVKMTSSFLVSFLLLVLIHYSITHSIIHYIHSTNIC